jgi:hypothetical protein
MLSSPASSLEVSSNDNATVEPSQSMQSPSVFSPEDVSLVSLRDLAQMFRVAPITIQRLVRRGVLTPIRFCRRLLFRRREVALALDRLASSAKRSSFRL